MICDGDDAGSLLQLFTLLPIVFQPSSSATYAPHPLWMIIGGSILLLLAGGKGEESLRDVTVNGQMLGESLGWEATWNGTCQLTRPLRHARDLLLRPSVPFSISLNRPQMSP